MTEVGLEVLRSLPQLTHLDLSGKQRTDSGLWFVGITDIGLGPVGTLAQLELLNLSGSLVSAKGVEKLAGLAQLRRLDLRGCKRIADGVAPVLQKMPALKWVNLYETAVTPAAAQALRTARSDLQVK